MSKLKDLARSLGLGRVAHLAWRRPVGRLRDLIADGGPFERRRTNRGRDDMAAAATTLPLLPETGGAPVPVHLLTGSRFWYQTAFCLWSLARAAGRPVRPTIYDDGTLGLPMREQLLRLFPATRFVETQDTTARLDALLPTARFPVLRDRWRHYPHIRKIIDPHVGGEGWKLVLDSDLLFFRRPDALLRQVDEPDRPLHAVDCATAYGYSRALMDRLAGRPVAALVNVGLTGLRGGDIDWDRMEFWARELTAQEGMSYYLEQALVALHLAGRPCAVLPAAEYLTFPKPPEAHECRAVMHHYVAGSKRWYYQQNWRRVLGGRP
jgi:hypothetical protein